MRVAIVVVSLFAFLPNAIANDGKGPKKDLLPAKNEIVMTPGMRITATTPVGTITITAVDDLTRSYTWEGATRSVEMGRRARRWYGSLGLVYPGPGDHWDEHRGITRGVLEEGQQHFKSVEEAMTWIKSRDWMPHVYRDDGLVVGWDKTLPRKQLSVDVWQILVNGKKPERLPGSHDDKIVVETVRTETSPLVQAVRKDDLTAVEALLTGGSDPETKNSVGTPVLVMAAKRGSGAIVEALLKKGAEPNARDEAGSTALLEAVEAGRTAIVRILLAGGANVNSSHLKGLAKGYTPLITAVMSRKEDIVQLLIEKGADVKAASANGATALSWARLLNHEGLVRRLQKAGADK